MPILAIYGIIAAVIFGIGAGVSWKFTSDHYEAKAAKDDRVALADFQTAVLGMNQLSKALEEKKIEHKIVYRTIEKRIPEVINRNVAVYHSDCITDDGLQLVNEALAGRLDNSRKHENGVSRPDSAGGQDGRGNTE